MKYVLVTGGSQGLGASIVNVFANNQYNVIIGYLNNSLFTICLINCKENECNILNFNHFYKYFYI